MTRQASGTDRKLIFEGRKLLVKKGASSLSIRELVDKASVNLGLFNYYFKTKDNFVEIVLEEIYHDFITDLGQTESGEGLEKLRVQLLVTTTFARDNRTLILSLFGDVLNEEKVVQKFVRTKMRKHLVILGKTIKQCQKDGLIIDAPLPLLITQIAGSIGLSNLIPEFLKRLGMSKAFNIGLGALSKNLATDKALNQRVDITLKGLTIQH
ncbi:MAG: TetR/AcrR family transcriptional regulator [Bdellovibrionaceae bacterium]|nr:TetR/AcrR family transcriptional regulator [Pseudobdellovibrionaceae bacterium]